MLITHGRTSTRLIAKKDATKMRRMKYAATSDDVAVHNGFMMSDQFAIVVTTSTLIIAYGKVSKVTRPAPKLPLQAHTRPQATQY